MENPMRPRLVTTLSLCLLLASVACSNQQDATADAPSAPESDGTAFSWTTPSGWLAETPSNASRKAQYRIAGAAGDAECIVFSFESDQGSDAMADAERWAEQFTLADGRSGKEDMQIEKRTVGNVEVLLVAISGTYKSVPMAKSKPQPPKPNQMLLGAIAKTPKANGFFKLTGPKTTVEAQRPAFDSLIASLKPRT
jgi:hypothetical protein